MRRNLVKQIAISLLLGVILFTTLGGIWVYSLYQNSFDVNINVITSYQTIRAANQALVSLNEAELAVNAYLVTGNSVAIKQFPETVISVQVNLATLKQLISDNTIEQITFHRLKPLVEANIRYLEKVIAFYKAGDKQAARNLASDEQRLLNMNQISNFIINIRRVELGQLNQFSPDYARMKNEANKYYLLFGNIIIIWLLLIYIVIRRYLYQADQVRS